MQTAAVREAIAPLQCPDEAGWGAIRPILGGWSFWTFAVSPVCIFRFATNRTVGCALEREAALLPALAKHVSFAVPRFEWFGEAAGLPFAGYRRIPGRALAAEDLGSADGRAAVATMLAELHGFPRLEAATLLGVAADVAPWRERYHRLRNVVEHRVTPLLTAPLRDKVLWAYDEFLGHGLLAFEHPVLTHCDLGRDHILVDDAASQRMGMIDFEDATLGDPAIDFVGLRIAFGAHATRDILARYGGRPDAGFWDRLHFYRFMGSVHAIVYGLDKGDDEIVSDGIEGLGERIEREPWEGA